MTTHPSISPAYPVLTVELRTELEDYLKRAEAWRADQLARLSPAPGDLVAAAHRDSVARILSEIRAAQARLASGTYGQCERCRSAIPPARLELRPWTTHCVACAHVDPR